MELKINHTWLASHLEADGAHDFTAGTFFEETEDLPEVPSIHNPMKEAFGTLVFLWRLDRNITPTKLAEMADVNLEEIELIERDGAYRPEPRTVVALAGVMKIPEVRLLQLSGHAETGDPSLSKVSSAFAANAKRWQQISREQKRLLNSYMKFLVKH